MTKIDVYSGFLGAGKTTLIRKMIAEGYGTQKLVLIENEFGEIGIDGGFLQEAGIEIREMNSGCICCSLVGDFGKALEQVISQYAPDRVIIEPSGVGKLSDVIAAVKKVTNDQVQLGYTVAVADAGKCKVYMRNFGEFYNNQIETASTIVLSRTDSISQEKLDTAVNLIREHNSVATLVTTPWNQLTGGQLVEAMEHKQTLADELARLELQRLENELLMVRQNLTKGAQLERILNDTFRQMESIVDVRQMTNAQLKRIVKEILVDHEGNVEIHLHVLGDLWLRDSIPVCDNRT